MLPVLPLLMSTLPTILKKIPYIAVHVLSDTMSALRRTLGTKLRVITFATTVTKLRVITFATTISTKVTVNEILASTKAAFSFDIPDHKSGKSNAAVIAAGLPKKVSAAKQLTLKDISNVASNTMLCSATLESGAKVAGAVSWVHQKGVQEGTKAIIKNILGQDSKEDSVNVKMMVESMDVLRRDSVVIKETLAHLDEELLPPRAVVSQPGPSDPPEEAKVPKEAESPEGPDASTWEDFF
ncbi:hypothetical protein Vadar_011186 [Vaccinium darrowii]|uniref:Uncharacterized protein n=1 Tax=Vaccinium darrowii TaxID=229202 RepID=A0ACB7XPW4_9ERIC|nr:hypothetical protein Vadar_011186 [Vaccinium darrowii]